MQSLFLVMIGGAVGAGLRHLVGRAVAAGAIGAGWPVATLLVNVVGGLSMGVLAGVLARSPAAGEPWRLLLGVGVLGGFTTFSAFSLELVVMLERGAGGTALAYALLSVAGAVAALFAGLSLARAWTGAGA